MPCKNLRISRSLIVALSLFTILAIVNVPLATLNRYSIHVHDYASATSGFTYTCYPEKGRKLEMMIREKNRFDEENNSSTQICRKFKKDYFKFWLWLDYATNRYYQFPYCK